MLTIRPQQFDALYRSLLAASVCEKFASAYPRRARLLGCDALTVVGAAIDMTERAGYRSMHDVIRIVELAYLYGQCSDSSAEPAGLLAQLQRHREGSEALDTLYREALLMYMLSED